MDVVEGVPYVSIVDTAYPHDDITYLPTEPAKYRATMNSFGESQGVKEKFVLRVSNWTLPTYNRVCGICFVCRIPRSLTSYEFPV